MRSRAVSVAGGLGLPALVGASVGGASDGNLTAGAGVPTLDGLGAVGGDAHATDEHLLVAELPRRAALLAASSTPCCCVRADRCAARAAPNVARPLGGLR